MKPIVAGTAVMAGLEPAISVNGMAALAWEDGRVEPGHDERAIAAQPMKAAR